MTFQNRIISYGVKAADQFLANPKNARLHPQFQRDVMKAALTQVGFVAPVIETRDGYLLDGHERIYQALAQNADVPYVVVDIDSEDPDADYVLATFDPITSLANYDRELLDALLKDVNSEDAAIQQMLSELAEKNRLYDPQDPNALWQGMPEFEQEGKALFHTLKVFFETENDLREFAQLIGQDIPQTLGSIYFPFKPKREIGVYIADEP